MQKTIALLTVLLAAQLLLAAGLSVTGPDLAALPPGTPLVDLAERTVDRITIEGADAQQVVLAIKDDGWVLPEVGEYPADKTRVEGLLNRLAGLKRGLAVATTASAQKRFKVSDDTFERRLKLAQGNDTLATLYFGTSPGARRVHVRTAGDDAVYTAEFGLYDAPLKAEEWEDKAVLQIPRDQIEAIKLAQLELHRVAEPVAGTAAQAGATQKPAQPGWTSAGLAEGESLNQSNAGVLAQKLSELRIGSVLGREVNPEYGLEAPQLVFTVLRNGGEAIEYRLGKRDKQNDYVLKVSSRPEYFRLPGYAADALIQAAQRQHLVSRTSEAAGTGDEAVQGAHKPAAGDPAEPDAGGSAAGAS